MPSASGLGFNQREARPRSVLVTTTLETTKQSLPERLATTAKDFTSTVWKPSNLDDVTGMVDKSIGVRTFAPILNVFFVYAFLKTLYQPGGWMADATRETLYVTTLGSLLPVVLAYRLGKVLYDFRGAIAGAFVSSAVIAAVHPGPSISTSLAFSLIAVPTVRLYDYLYEQVVAPLKFDTRLPYTFRFVSEVSFGVLMVLASVASFEAAGSIVSWSLTAMRDANVELLATWKPLSAMIIEPAKVLFIDSEVQAHLVASGNHLLSANLGVGAGLLIAVMVCGSKVERPSAAVASLLLVFAGSHIVYYPFVYMHPLTIVALVASGVLGTLVFDSSNASLKQPLTTGSIINLAESTTDGDAGKIVAGLLVSLFVSFVVSCVLMMPRARLMSMMRMRE